MLLIRLKNNEVHSADHLLRHMKAKTSDLKRNTHQSQMRLAANCTSRGRIDTKTMVPIMGIIIGFASLVYNIVSGNGIFGFLMTQTQSITICNSVDTSFSDNTI